MRILCGAILAGLLLAQGAVAQEGTPLEALMPPAPSSPPAQSLPQSQPGGSAAARVPDFNLFTHSGSFTGRLFTFDESYTQRTGLAAPVPFRITVPFTDSLTLKAEGARDGSVARFTYLAPNGAVVETMQVIEARFPVAAAPERLALIDQVLARRIFPLVTRGFEKSQIVAVEPVTIAGLPSVHLLATAVDDRTGLSYYLRIVAIPHPEQEKSLVMVNYISADAVPLSGPALVGLTLFGRALDTFSYL